MFQEKERKLILFTQGKMGNRKISQSLKAYCFERVRWRGKSSSEQLFYLQRRHIVFINVPFRYYSLRANDSLYSRGNSRENLCITVSKLSGKLLLRGVKIACFIFTEGIGVIFCARRFWIWDGTTSSFPSLLSFHRMKKYFSLINYVRSFVKSYNF